MVAMIAVAAGKALAEHHTVMFENKCGGVVLSTGAAYTSNGPIIGAIAYLQTGNCGLYGENCTVVELTLEDPTAPGTGSISDISLIPPRFLPCAPAGADCTNANCGPAFQNPTDHSEAVSCEADNADIVIIFCD
ncbi:hypothetical protein C8R45DRAFT_1054821 [Mycena sanguinolenta]|nr:hypothetical protein C8R45DRAFT_1054821 [Mycena sanguinolenta]